MKKILALILAMLMIVGVLASCGESSNDNGDDAQNGANGNGEGVEDAKPNNGDDQNENDPAKSLMSYVLSNSEYKNLIQKGVANYEYTNSAAYDPHPYAYLAAKGHDVEAIKNGTIECDTLTYVLEEKPDVLYMGVKVYENGVATHYHFGVKLTKSQMEDYEKINSEPYVQAPFTNDAITTLNKNIIEETCFKMSEYDSKGLDAGVGQYKKGFSAHVVNVNPEEQTFTAILLTKSNVYLNTSYSYSYLNTNIRISEFLSADTLLSEDNIFYTMPASFSHILQLEETEKPGRVYDLQDFDWAYCSLDLT